MVPDPDLVSGMRVPVVLTDVTVFNRSSSLHDVPEHPANPGCSLFTTHRFPSNIPDEPCLFTTLEPIWQMHYPNLLLYYPLEIIV